MQCRAFVHRCLVTGLGLLGLLAFTARMEAFQETPRIRHLDGSAAQARGASIETVPPGPGRVVYSMQSARTGATDSVAASAAGGGPEALVYLNDTFSGFGVFDNYNASTGALFPGTMISDNLGLGNGFKPGGTISSYSLEVFRSTLDPQPGVADIHVELWDGDPFCVIDTPGQGFSCSPIAGTEADFVNLPAASFLTLDTVLPKGVTAPNTRVWMTISTSETANPAPCRLGWLISGLKPSIGNDLPDDLFEDQFDEDGRANGGTCCIDGSACNATDPICAFCGSTGAACLSDADCPAGDRCFGGAEDGDRGFCSDLDAEVPGQFFFGGPCDGLPGDFCATFMAQVRAPAEVTMSLVPTGNGPAGTCSPGSPNAGDLCNRDESCGGGTCLPALDPGASISGNEITLSQGDTTVFLEIRLSDWDPFDVLCLGGANNGLACVTDADCPMGCEGGTNDGAACTTDADCPGGACTEGSCGRKLKAYQAALDSSGYTSGLKGTLTPKLVACVTDDDCIAPLGGNCSLTGTPCTVDTDCPIPMFEVCLGAACDFPLGVGGFCSPALVQISRSDFVFAPPIGNLAAVDTTTPNFRWASVVEGAAVDEPEPFPAGGLYGGTLVLEVPLDAQGTFEIGFFPIPLSSLVDHNNGLIPLVGFAPGKISIASACCLPDGSCVVDTPDFCNAAGGTVVSACRGDSDGNGKDDACDFVVQPGEDCWRTGCGATKASFCDHPIPADFFGPGSKPFDGVIHLGGSGAGDFDTSVRRLDTMALTDVGSEASTPIELVSLSLVSCAPIAVNLSGGGTTEWNVRVGLSGLPAPQGSMTATKTHENGGTFRSFFFVQPTFTFTRVDDPGDVRILDSAAAGMPPIKLATMGAAPWVHRPSPGNTVFLCGDNFAPGVQEDPVTGEQCCRKVGHAGPGHIHETAPPDCSSCPSGACCLADGTCQVTDPAGPQTAQQVCEANPGAEYKGDATNCNDTDGDGIPDVMESNDCCGPRDACNTGTNPNDADTDGDGCTDGEEIAGGTDPCDSCDFLPSCVDRGPDCNNNGVRDECDLISGTSQDCNGNDQPDDCEPGACCGTSVTTGTAACVTSQNKDQCDALTPPGTFLGPCETCPPQSTGIATHGSNLIIHSVGDPIECPGGAAPGVFCQLGAVKIDPWKSLEEDPANPAICHNFGAAGEAIPADFFCPNSNPACGSDPFTGAVCLEGLALGATPFGDFGDADTLIQRLVDPFSRCELPTDPPAEVTVDIEIVALKLAGVDPITVTFNGGQNPEQWTVSVDLSDQPQTIGSLTARKTHCNGGVYSATLLPVQPKFVFTNVVTGDVKTLDRGAAGLDPVSLIMPGLDTGGAASWVHDVDPALGVAIDVCSEFHPGIEDAEPTLFCDCNGNLWRDRCDIEDGTSLDCNTNGIPDECDVSSMASADCNGNGIPDECEPDCNGNGVPDACDVDPADPDGDGSVSADCNGNGIPDECEPDCNGNGVPDECDVDPSDPDGNGLVSADCSLNGIPDECEPDCNGNGIADACDIASGFSQDTDGDGIPDDCNCDLSARPDPDLIVLDVGFGTKNRYLSFRGVQGGSRAIRVTFADLPGSFGLLNGKRAWVGPPRDVSEQAALDDASPPTFKAATLQCEAFYTDWSALGTVHVYDRNIVPGGRYQLQSLDQGCAENVLTFFSAPLEVTASAWGDVSGLFDVGGNQWSPPDGSVDIPFDIVSILDKFSNLPGAPIKARADLQPGVPDQVIDILDVTRGLDAFGGARFPFGPGPACL